MREPRYFGLLLPLLQILNPMKSRLLALLCYLDACLPEWLAACLVFALWIWIGWEFTK